MSMYRQFLPYAVAICSTAIALLLSLGLAAILNRTMGAFFYLAIAISTWYGGLRPGIAAIILSTLALGYYFIPPTHQFQIASFDNGLRLTLFVIVALMANLLVANLKESKRKIEQLNRQLAEDSANRLQTALSAAQMGLWDWNLVTGAVIWSPEHERLFGLPPGSFDGRHETFEACLHPDDREGLKQVIAHALQNGEAYCHEFRTVWPDGSIHWIEGHGQAFYNESGQPVRLSGSGMIIDQRQQSQLLLQQQFEQQRLVMEMSQRIRQSLDLQEILQTTVKEVRQFLQVDRVIIFQFNPDWGGTVTIESVVDEALAILPFNIYDPCIGNTYVEPFQQGLVTAKADIYTADISPCHVEFLAQFQVRANLVVPILKNDELWGLLAAHHCIAPRQWQSSEVDLLRQIAAQVSIALRQSDLFAQVQTELVERKQTEMALQENEEKLRLLIKYAPASIAMLDQNMCYIMASQRWVDDHHLDSIESLISRSHYDIFPEVPERWRQGHQRCLAGAIEKCDEDLFVRANGTQQWVSWETRPWYTADSQIGGIIIFVEEITDRKRAELALRESEARLRLAQFASNSATWDWDIQTNTLIWSPEHYQLYGLDLATEPSYENWLRCIHPDDREQANQKTLRALENAHTELRTEFRVLRSGEIRWFAGIGQVLRNDTGKATRVIGIAIDITEQKQSEIALQALNRELEQRVVERTVELQQTHDLLSNFFNAASLANIGLCIHDLDLRFLQVNAALADFNGHSVEAHLGKTTKELLPELAPTINPLLQQVLVTGQPILNVEMTAEVPSQSKAIRDWLVSFFPILQRNGGTQTIGVGVIVIEISDRKQAEATLQQQTRLERLRWNITQAIRQSLDLNAILNTAVEQIRQTLQVDRVAVYRFQPNWSGHFITESVSPDWVKLVDAGVQTVWKDTYLQETQGGRFQNHETFIISDIYTAGLQPCHIEILEQFQAKAYAIAPIFSGETLWGLLAIYQNTAARDWQAWEIELLQQIASQLAIAIQQSELYSQLQVELQERKQTEAVLREAERRWRSLLENVQLIVVGLDQSGCINYVNPFFLALTGYTETEVLGKDWFETFLLPSRQQPLQKVFEVINQNVYPYYEGFILTKSGEERLIAWNNTQLQDFGGDVIGTISIGEDITERQKVEKMKDEFIGVVSHELRTPLTSIQMSLGLLKTGVYAKKPEKSQRMIEIALIDTNRLVNLVNDILDLERLESGRILLEKTLCQASNLMQQAMNGVQAIAIQEQITLTITPTDVTVWAAADTIIQTLTNLLSNAIKFSPSHSGIHLGAEHQADHVLFQVSDQGRGIPADKLEAIFGRFQQVDVSDSREKGGTGLGLAICRSIVERHGGKIWAESRLGEGSTFFFTLPIPIESKP